MANQYYEKYSEYNNTLRAWFVTFGIGAPALFIVNENLGKTLAASGATKLVLTYFLIGAGAQILIAFINKVVNWCCYYGEESQEFKKSRRCKVANRISKQFGIDILLDAFTIVAFAIALWKLYTVFT